MSAGFVQDNIQVVHLNCKNLKTHLANSVTLDVTLY